MADWEQLRDLAREVVPPEFTALERTARRRRRRTRALVGTLAALVLVGGGIGLATTDRGGTVQPLKDPTQTDTGVPPGVHALPEAAFGESSVTVPAGRYRVALDDALAFDVDLPDETSAHEDGLFLATESFILKAEIAGEEYGVPRQPCTDQHLVPVGPTVDDLVRALSDLPVYRVSRPQRVELGGHDATYLEARIPRSYDSARCDDRTVKLPGNPDTVVGGPAPYVGRWWVLDVDGRRVVVQQNCWGCTQDVYENAPQVPQSITFTSTR